MALPSAVTLGSVAIVFAAGAGLGVVAAGVGEEKPARDPGRKAAHASAAPPSSTIAPAKPRRQHVPDPIPKTLVDVFNNSGEPGLAARSASFLEGAGWNVAATDNWYGDIPADTVYFPPGVRSAAAALAKALRIHRLHPAVAPMQFDRLTVILTGS